MPYINVKLSASVDSGARDVIARGITTLMVQALGKRQEATSVLVERTDNATWTIGAAPAAVAAHVDATITKGTNSEAQKRDFLNGVSKLMKDVLGPGLPVYTYAVLHEVDGYAWGYDGISQHERMMHINTI